MSARECGYHRLLADLAYYATNGHTYEQPTETCAVPPTRYAEVCADAGGLISTALCGDHDTAAQALAGYDGSVPLNVPAPAVAPPERRCRRCSATTGLRRLVGSPLSLAGPAWECANGCAR